MVGTRRSARHAGNNSSSPGSSQSKPEPATGSKRQADSAAKKPPAKRGKKAGQEEQTTIEASMPDSNEKGDADDLDMKDDLEDNPAETGDGVAEVAKREEDVRDQEDVNGGKGEEEKKATQITAGDTNGAPNGEGKDNQKNGFDAIMGDKDKDVDNNVTTEGTGSKVSQADNAVEQSKRREEEVPSNILEKGLICKYSRAPPSCWMYATTLAHNHPGNHCYTSLSRHQNKSCRNTRVDFRCFDRFLFPWPCRYQ